MGFQRTIPLFALMAVSLLSLTSMGCEKRGAAEPFGKTYYVGGAANIDSFISGVPDGLRLAGYRGDVESFIWTLSFNPIIDQLITVNARARASLLTREIEQYHKRYPKNEINVIGLSAGTGVSTWAIERLKTAKVNNLILLGSSLSHTYDMTKALKNIKGNIYVYYSSTDRVLDAVRVVGTIDGKRGVDSIGQVGLSKPQGAEHRISNTAWSRKFLRFGWAGGHTDCIRSKFVRHVLGPHIVPRTSPTGPPPQSAKGDKLASR